MSMNPLRKPKPKPPLLAPEWGKRLKTAFLCALGVAFLAAGSLYGMNWLKRHPSKPAPEAKPVEVAKYIASDSFDKLRLPEKEALFESLRPKAEAGGVPPDPRAMMKDLSETERRAVFEKMMQLRDAKTSQAARAYLKLPPDARAAWMANYVAEQDKRREEMRERMKQMRQQRQAQGGKAGSNGPGGPDGGPGGPPPP